MEKASRTRRERLIKDKLSKSLLIDSHFYRNIAMRLASGRWLGIDPMDTVKLRECITANTLPVDDYIMVSPVAYASIRSMPGFTDVTPEEIVTWNIYGYLDSGLEVRVVSMMQSDRLVIGSTPRTPLDESVKMLPVLGIALPSVSIVEMRSGCVNGSIWANTSDRYLGVA